MFAEHRVVIRRHLVVPGPAVHVAHVHGGGQTADQRGIELGFPAHVVAVEILAGRFVPLGEGQDDAVGIAGRQRVVVAPMHAARVDHHREARGPRVRQGAAEEELAHRLDRHRQSGQRRHASRLRPGRVHDHRRVEPCARGQRNAGDASATGLHAAHDIFHVLDARGLRRRAKAEEHLAWIRVAVVGAEEAEADVVEREPGHERADRVNAQPLLHGARVGLCGLARGERRSVRVVGQEEIAALAKPRVGRVRGRAHACVELAPQPHAVLHHAHAHGGGELLTDAAHRQERRRARVAAVALHHHDAAGEAVLPQTPGRARPHHAAADDDDVGRAPAVHGRVSLIDFTW